MTARPPGRPREVDITRVARSAVDLFTERGYESVSMDDVASAAGISRRSLFNHFATKAELLWSGHEFYVDRLRRHLMRPSGQGAALTDVLTSGFVRALDDLGEDGLALARARLRVVSAHPDTAAVGQVVVAACRAVVLDHLRTRVRGELTCRCIAGGVAAAAYEALMWWAAGDAPDPERDISSGIAALTLRE
ncbi:TetR/AcrR family transcriptional regulator [Pseudonocardia sp. ICBG1293]|uniref:TetR/AcrR family transcriptional regulator n=1 Tax=Pseudonocardia sp. ICBG1293 TaxID=2844382 RepID=UPI001CCEF5DC|nr:TetR/AcrR family transcriptional regulator [Pseudonocardia sp. ICBG1293]